ncbi:MAG: methionine synthase [Selenomonadaceae bacterium]|nr:methionine synthase [Selenomonadaceae bacterium]
MSVYNGSLTEIDLKEARRYAGLAKVPDFAESLLEEAAANVLLLATPRGTWQEYDYDCAAGVVRDASPFALPGEKIRRHLSGCEKVIILAATVGEAVEEAITAKFEGGDYTLSLLMDAAATAAVEQVADALEKAVSPRIKAQGYFTRWRFSPGYGDFPLEAQPEILRLSRAADICLSLSSSLMLMPRKSISAVLGLYREGTLPNDTLPQGCGSCGQKNCVYRQKV